MDMGSENQFIRSPIAAHRVFCLESSCVHCGFTILASSIYDLLEEEEGHRQTCSLLHKP
jgi:hypothetical protein